MFNLLRDRHRSDADRSRYILVPKRMGVANELEKEHVVYRKHCNVGLCIACFKIYHYSINQFLNIFYFYRYISDYYDISFSLFLFCFSLLLWN